jgi:hypothetical protein
MSWKELHDGLFGVFEKRKMRGGSKLSPLVCTDAQKIGS